MSNSKTNWGAEDREILLRQHKKTEDSYKLQLEQKEKSLLALQDQLAQVRSARFNKLTPASPVTRKQGDIVRFIFSDLHGSLMHKPSIASLLGDIAAMDPDEIYLNGDIVECGGFLAQHHTLGYVAQTEYTYEDDIAQGNHFLDQLRAAAPHAKIEYLEGNHEKRVETWCVDQAVSNSRDAEFLRRNNAPEFLLGLASRGISYYRMSKMYDGLTVPGTIKRGKVYITHGFSTAKDAVGATLARIAGNVVFGHTHRHQSTLSHLTAVGTVGSWNPGCLCEMQPLYLHTNPSSWTRGYSIQFVRKSGDFLHCNIPIINGESLLVPLLNNQSSEK